ncbi:hypothetical protein Hanom_Chr03g00196941 [Helianthus anomalus]
MTLEVSGSKHVSYPSLMAMGICRQGSLSGGELGREIPSAVRGTVQLPFLYRHDDKRKSKRKCVFDFF